MSNRLPKNGPLGTSRPDNRHHDFHERAFPGAVWAQQPEDFTSADAHADSPQSFHPAVFLRDIQQVDCRIAVCAVHIGKLFLGSLFVSWFDCQARSSIIQ